MDKLTLVHFARFHSFYLIIIILVCRVRVRTGPSESDHGLLERVCQSWRGWDLILHLQTDEGVFNWWHAFTDLDVKKHWVYYSIVTMNAIISLRPSNFLVLLSDDGLIVCVCSLPTEACVASADRDLSILLVLCRWNCRSICLADSQTQTIT